MGNEMYPHGVTMYSLLLIAGISVTMQMLVQTPETKKEIKYQIEMLKNVTVTKPENCLLKPFRQVWSPSGCKHAYIALNYCLGMCHSISIPNRGQQSLVKVCKPTKWEHQNVTVACLENGKYVYRTKQVKKIYECSCDWISIDVNTFELD